MASDTGPSLPRLVGWPARQGAQGGGASGASGAQGVGVGDDVQLEQVRVARSLLAHARDQSDCEHSFKFCAAAAMVSRKLIE